MIAIDISKHANIKSYVKKYIAQKTHYARSIKSPVQYIQRVAKIVPDIVNVFYIAVFVELWHELVDRSPVSTGFFRANWQMASAKNNDLLYESEYRRIDWVLYNAPGKPGVVRKKPAKIQTGSGKVSWPSEYREDRSDPPDWYRRVIMDPGFDGVPKEDSLIPRPDYPVNVITEKDIGSGSLWVFNNVPYASSLELGKSWQAPTGTFLASLAAVKARAKDMAKEFKLSSTSF